MFGTYYDNRTHKHLQHIYTRVPYLDTQIFDIETQSIRQSRRIKNRTDKATQALQRTRLKSQHLANDLRESRTKREDANKSFLLDMEKSHTTFLERQKAHWNQFTASKTATKEHHLREQVYLSDKLKSTSTKAASRLMSVRRWD